MLLDVLRGERFVCQLRYPTERCRMAVSDTGVYYVIDAADLERFVVERRPTLRGVRDLRIHPTTYPTTT